MVDMPEGTALEAHGTGRRGTGRGRAGGRDRRRRAAVRRHLRAVQLQRARASLLSAPGAAPGRSAGEPGAQGRAVRAEPRHREACSRPAAADRPVVRRARCRWRRCRLDRPSCRRWWPRSTDPMRPVGRSWPRRSRRSSSRRPAWWISTGTSRRRSRRSRSSWTARRPRCSEHVVDRGRGGGPNGWLLERAPGCCTTRRRAKTCRSSIRLPRRRAEPRDDSVPAAERDQARSPLASSRVSCARRRSTSLYHKNLQAGDLRHRRSSPGRNESPVYAILEMNKALAQSHACPRDTRSRSSTRRSRSTREVRDEVGRRMAHHHRSVPRSRARLRGRAGADLRARGRMVPVVHDAADHHGRDPVLARRHPAGARG